jgi:predicted metalloprotease with PDZ domain
MRFLSQTMAALLLAAPAVAAAAQIRVYRDPGSSGRIPRTAVSAPRAVIGISTSSGATSRDTLGVLVGDVRAGGPAEKAGIVEGDRIAAINGVSLQLASADVGDEQMAGAMTRRLSRQLEKVKPGDEVELRVASGAQRRTVKIRTVAREELDERSVNRRDADRATLGVNLAVTGTDRDTLGVFVIGVADGGPAALAGIEEGSRIAAVNGVDLRAARGPRGAGAGDDVVARTANVRRLEREVARATPGDTITLRVYYDKQFRTVTVKAGRAADLPRRVNALTILGGDGSLPMAEMPRVFDGPERMPLELPGRVERGRDLGDSVQRLLDGVRAWSTAFPRVGTRLDW